LAVADTAINSCLARPFRVVAVDDKGMPMAMAAHDASGIGKMRMSFGEALTRCWGIDRGQPLG
jgi:hypothetical protein